MTENFNLYLLEKVKRRERLAYVGLSDKWGRTQKIYTYNYTVSVVVFFSLSGEGKEQRDNRRGDERKGEESVEEHRAGRREDQSREEEREQEGEGRKRRQERKGEEGKRRGVNTLQMGSWH